MKRHLFSTKLDNELWIYNQGRTLRPNGLLIKTNLPNYEFSIIIDNIDQIKAYSDNNGIIYSPINLVDNILILKGTIEASSQFVIEKSFLVAESPHLPKLDEILDTDQPILVKELFIDDLDDQVIISPYEITWRSENIPGDYQVRLELYDDEFFVRILDTVDNTGSYMWDNTVDVPSLAYSVLILLEDDESVWDRTSQFELARSITIDNIDSNVINSPYEITWTTVNIPNDKMIKIDLYDSLGLVRELDVVENSGSYLWDNEIDTVQDDYYIKATVVYQDTITDDSNVFELVRTITLTSPIDGIITNAYHTITWETVNINSDRTIRIEYIGLTSGLIAEVLNTGSYVWDNTGLDAGDYQIKLSLVEV